MLPHLKRFGEESRQKPRLEECTRLNIGRQGLKLDQDITTLPATILGSTAKAQSLH